MWGWHKWDKRMRERERKRDEWLYFCPLVCRHVESALSWSGSPPITCRSEWPLAAKYPCLMWQLLSGFISSTHTLTHMHAHTHTQIGSYVHKVYSCLSPGDHWVGSSTQIHNNSAILKIQLKSTSTLKHTGYFFVSWFILSYPAYTYPVALVVQPAA